MTGYRQRLGDPGPVAPFLIYWQARGLAPAGSHGSTQAAAVRVGPARARQRPLCQYRSHWALDTQAALPVGRA